MIFVTVGNATQGFRRLLDAIEGLTSQGFFGDETTLIQKGSNADFASGHALVRTVLPPLEFLSAVGSASLIICHGGAGTLIEVLRAGKLPVAVPRRPQCGEAVDDHQMELVGALARERRVIPAYEVADLPEAILQARRLTSGRGAKVSAAPTMLARVADAIEELSRGRRSAR